MRGNSRAQGIVCSRFATLAWPIVIGILWTTGCGSGAESDMTGLDADGTLDSSVVSDDASTQTDLLTPAELTDPATTLSFSAGPIFCCNPLSIEFAAEVSGGESMNALKFAWSFGDGRTAVGQTVRHTYTWFANYTVTLTAHRSDGAAETVQQTLSLRSDEFENTEVVAAPPPPDDEAGVIPATVGPAAEAGPDQSVRAGETVTLDGSGSHSTTGGTFAYRWAQTGGPYVALNASDQAVVTFVAPQVEQTLVLSFSLTVVGDSLRASDEVVVLVTSGHPNSPPTVSDQNVSVEAGNGVVLTLMGQDTDADDLTFSIVTAPEGGTLGAIDNSALSTAAVLFTPGPNFARGTAFTFRVSDGKADSNVVATFTVSACESLKIIPWVEANYQGLDEQVIEGLLIWRKVTDTAIVTTRPGRAALYTKLRERVPGMRIIPGLKTMDLLDRFDSVNGWQAISQEVSAIRQASGERALLLENEVAIRPWVVGEQSLDLDKLAEALAQLPGDVEYIWRPSIYWFIAGNEGVQRLAQVCRVAEDVFENVRFEDQRYCARENINSQVYTATQALLDSIASRPTLTKLYFYGPDQPHVWWKDSEFPEALSYVRNDRGAGTDVTIFPGWERWGEAASSLTEQLLPSCPTAAP